MKKFICLFILMLLAASHNISAQNIGFSYDADGNMESRYIVTLKSSSDPQSEEEEIISVELSEQKITIYPNPTQGEICVEISPLDQEEENFIHIFDSLGQLLDTKKIVSERTYLEISGSPGVYLLNIHLGTNISKWKIIKQ
ncbi:MAG: T9SS type A sorting domain-containing protein [Dysgonamonadaceae bacterium]|jgi:hypothetical protein|nr:T9SS type A sorting domain-containing protein [Dysgonamonadaceae bacterium]